MVTTQQQLDRLDRTLAARAPEVDALRREIQLAEQLLEKLRRERARAEPMEARP
jgi:hypothetical protein